MGYYITEKQNRSILFYDQLGAGESDEPADVSLYSIEQAVDDLEQLLIHTGIVDQDANTATETPPRCFHLYGHSFGGVLAYEFVKRSSYVAQQCRSLVLSSTPWNMSETSRDYDALEAAAGSASNFFTKHICRKVPTPFPVLDAYRRPGKVWVGTDAVMDYQATPILSSSKQQQQQPSSNLPVLALRGEYDFISKYTNDVVWKAFLTPSAHNNNNDHPRTSLSTKSEDHDGPEYTSLTLSDCSHHALNENPILYTQTLEDVWQRYDDS